MAGTIGNAAVVYNLLRNANANQAIAKITPSAIISPYYLAAFLNSKYGLLQTQREVVSCVQANIFLGTIKKFKVPIFGREQMAEIEDKYQSFLQELENAKLLYSQAESLLLEKLGLKDFAEEQSLYSVVNFSELKETRRMDAEYFQPKYKQLLNNLSKNFNLRFLGDVASIKRGSLIAPRFYSDTSGTPYIRGGDFSSGRFEKIGLVYINDNFQPKSETRVKEGDIVFASIGSVGTLAVVPKELDKSFISNNTAKISIKDKEHLIPEYLGLTLHSIIGKLQFEKEMSQTAQPKISDSQVKSFYIPTLSEATQQKIAELVKQSHEARRKAKSLLEEAKHKVEELIEKAQKV